MITKPFDSQSRSKCFTRVLSLVIKRTPLRPGVLGLVSLLVGFKSYSKPAQPLLRYTGTSASTVPIPHSLNMAYAAGPEGAAG